MNDQDWQGRELPHGPQVALGLRGVEDQGDRLEAPPSAALAAEGVEIPDAAQEIGPVGIREGRPGSGMAALGRSRRRRRSCGGPWSIGREDAELAAKREAGVDGRKAGAELDGRHHECRPAPSIRGRWSR